MKAQRIGLLRSLQKKNRKRNQPNEVEEGNIQYVNSDMDDLNVKEESDYQDESESKYESDSTVDDRIETRDSNHYEVESIIDKVLDKKTGKELYCIKWKGYPNSSNTWEPRENLTTCPAKLAKFEYILEQKRKNDRELEIKSIERDYQKQDKRFKQQITKKEETPTVQKSWLSWFFW